MTTARIGPVLAVAMVIAATLAGGCNSGRRSERVMLENQSGANLEVEVTLPSRGMFGRKPAHDGYRTFVDAGAAWESNRDTLRFAALPNDVRGFRVTVIDRTQAAHRTYAPFSITDSRTFMHVIFRDGVGGGLTWQAVSSGGRAMGEAAALAAVE